jgi:hypothetical protein
LQYMQTIAERYVADNLSPEIAIQMARLQNSLSDQYMQAREDYRRAAYGKVTQEGNEKFVPGRAGGRVRMTDADRLKWYKAEHERIKTIGDADEIARRGMEGNVPDSVKHDKTAIKEIAKYDKQLRGMEVLFADMGLPMGSDGLPDLSQVPDDISGLGAAYSLGLGKVASLTASEDSAMRKRIENVVKEGARLHMGPSRSEAAKKELEKNIIGGLSEREQLEGLVNMYKSTLIDRDTLVGHTAKPTQAYVNRHSEEGKRNALKYAKNQGLDMKEVEF